MANLTEVSQWENVIRQIENGEAATGGADGLANVQAKQLANRTQYLKNNYLPLTGGALNGDNIYRNVDNNQISISGGSSRDKGARLYLNGDENGTAPGEFGLYARNNIGNHSYLVGKPTGELYWNDNDLAGAVIISQSTGDSGYIKFANGFSIQWGIILAEISGATSGTINYPISFQKVCSVSAIYYENDTAYMVRGINEKSFKWSRTDSTSSLRWIALGY